MKRSAWWCVALGLMARVAAGCDFDCLLEREMRAQGIAGTVYSIVDGDDTRVGAAGLAHVPSRQPLRTDARMHIGSVTKTLLALGVLRLVSQHRVDLDARIADLLPQVALDNPWQHRSPVTLRHLLDHTSGLDDLRLWQLFTLRADPHAPLHQAFTHPADLLRVRVEPGTTFSYSNMGYTLAGMVIEAVTGERYEAWLDRELLRPLQMRDSTFEFVSQSGARADPRLAWGHHDDLEPAEALAVWLRPAAQFTTTAADMARVARLLMDDGRVDGTSFIDAGLLQQMGRASTTEAAAAGLEAGYALGLAMRDRHGVVGRCHIGNIIGFRAVLCVYPEARKAFFLAQNTDSETAQYLRFDDMFVRELGVSTAIATPYAVAQMPVEWEGRYVASPARFESFRYFDLLDSLTLRVDARGLTLDRLGGDAQRLMPAGPRLYRAEDRRQASHALLMSGGTPMMSDGTRSWRRIGTAWFAWHVSSAALGVVGLLLLLVSIPWRAWRGGEPLLQPATVAILLLLVPLPLFATQPFTAIGDPTAASLAVYIATLALPLLMLGQVAWAWRGRARLVAWKFQAVSALLVLQWCASLVAWDLMPLALWR